MQRKALWLAVAALAAAVLGLVPHPVWSIRTGKLALLEVVFLVIAASLVRPRWLRWALWLSVVGFVLHYNARSAVTTWRLLMAGLSIHFLASYLRGCDLSRLLTGWRIITLVNTGYMLMQLIGVDPLFVPVMAGRTHIVGGLMDGTMLAGAYTAMTLPLFSPKKWRWALALSMVAILATHSLGAVMVAMVMLLWILGWKTALMVVPILALVFTVAIEPIGYKLEMELKKGRPQVWRMGLGMMRHGPKLNLAIGVGPGQYAPQIQRYHRRTEYRFDPTLHWNRAHNEPLQVFQEFGAIGLCLFLFGVGRWLLAGWWSADASVQIVFMVVVGWLMTACYTHVGHVAVTAIVAVVGVAVLEREQRYGSRTPAYLPS